MGAVIGREFQLEVLQAVTGLAEQEPLPTSAPSPTPNPLYVRGLLPHTTYLFKHAFTQEAAYRSRLTPRRRDIHRRVAPALEALFPDRLQEALAATGAPLPGGSPGCRGRQDH